MFIIIILIIIIIIVIGYLYSNTYADGPTLGQSHKQNCIRQRSRCPPPPSRLHCVDLSLVPLLLINRLTD